MGLINGGGWNLEKSKWIERNWSWVGKGMSYEKNFGAAWAFWGRGSWTFMRWWSDLLVFLSPKTTDCCFAFHLPCAMKWKVQFWHLTLLKTTYHSYACLTAPARAVAYSPRVDVCSPHAKPKICSHLYS